MTNKRQIKPIKVHGKIKLAKLKPVKLIQNTNIRKVKNMEIEQVRYHENNGKKVADALRMIQRGFMEARGISRDDIRVRDILEVRKDEK